MKNLISSKWILLVNTLPICILFALFYRQFEIIESLLSDESKELWGNFGIALLVIGVLNLGYTLGTIFTKKSAQRIYAITSLIIHIGFIYIYSTYSHEILPWSIPRWMLSENLFVYVGTFLMPSLAYSVFILVISYTKNLQDQKLRNNIFYTLLFPIGCFVLFQAALPLWRIVNSGFSEHVFILFIIVGVIFFMFFLIRTFYILVTRKSKFFTEYQLVWKIPITIILPIVGLTINNGQVYSGLISSGIFGNFHNPWFYILALANGILICTPNPKESKFHLFVFIARCITFTFSLYFLLVFLPFLPFSIILIVFFGLGFLILAPLVVFIIHVSEIGKDFKKLSKEYSKALLRAIIVISLLVIPVSVVLNYKNDKRILNETLEYLYSPDYSKKYEINKTSLKRTLQAIQQQKNRDNDWFFGRKTPYLSTIFNSIVLENLTLSDKKVNHIKKIFFNVEKKKRTRSRANNNTGKTVKISDLEFSSTYDSDQKIWKSWIDLELTNTGNRPLREYETEFNLPEGTFISDYYLYVNGVKEFGILAEKKSAMWVYSQIRNVNRDPGILNYKGKDQIQFRVFPFAANEVRKTGFQLIHKTPIQFNIGNQHIELGEKKEGDAGFESDLLSFIPENQKKNLKSITRKPYVHFIVDVSENTYGKDEESYVSRIKDFTKKYPELIANAKISFTNSHTNTYNFNNNWESQLSKIKKEGGFYLSHSIKKIASERFLKTSDIYPVVVVISSNYTKAVVDKSLGVFSVAFPESNSFFRLTEEGTIKSYPFTNSRKEIEVADFEKEFVKEVLYIKNIDGKEFYLKKNAEGAFIIKRKDVQYNLESKNLWENAITMKADWMLQKLIPKKGNKEWIALVRESFRNRVMTPVTSFLVVENEAQKQMLKRKQGQVLSAGKSLDVGEAQEMSEPDTLYLVISVLLILFTISKNIKSRKINVVSINKG